MKTSASERSKGGRITLSADLPRVCQSSDRVGQGQAENGNGTAISIETVGSSASAAGYGCFMDGYPGHFRSGDSRDMFGCDSVVNDPIVVGVDSGRNDGLIKDPAHLVVQQRMMGQVMIAEVAEGDEGEGVYSEAKITSAMGD